MLANLLSLKVIHLREAKIHSIPPKVAKIVQTFLRWGASCYFNYFWYDLKLIYGYEFCDEVC